ncbi:molybdenum cofactor guanylyltransferase [Gemmatimonas groenlandica]|uniref:NTP transferase domain-containing protein n=1 Tax=Gemmatimonas groenlandica TaxID=2732249 RepID=A0A6M4IKW8_9BACT|nr:NTP transferase domain-containing protein [Gemmatimonas groenlandica]QJR35363.1 NTP transferase domain-containing protein [Gemmatimonas groenlandica]
MPRTRTLAPLFGLVLTGGASSRMGRDKATIAYHGTPQWRHVADMLRACGADPYWSCTAQQGDAWLLGDRAIVDAVPGHGPASGLHAAFSAAFSRDDDAAWLVIGCDYPWLDAYDVQRLVDARAEDVEAISYLNPGSQEIEPMIALWEPAAQQRFLQAFDRGERSARRILRTCALRLLDPPTPRALENRNADLADTVGD